MYIYGPDDYSGYSGDKVDILHKTIISEKFIVNFNNVEHIRKRQFNLQDGNVYEIYCQFKTYDMVLYHTEREVDFNMMYENLVEFIKSDKNWFEYKCETD